MNDTDIKRTVNWFKEAYPLRTGKNLHTQLGVHFEEIAELLKTIDLNLICFLRSTT